MSLVRRVLCLVALLLPAALVPTLVDRGPGNADGRDAVVPGVTVRDAVAQDVSPPLAPDVAWAANMLVVSLPPTLVIDAEAVTPWPVT